MLDDSDLEMRTCQQSSQAVAKWVPFRFRIPVQEHVVNLGQPPLFVSLSINVMRDHIRLPNRWQRVAELRQVIAIVRRDQILIFIAQNLCETAVWPGPQVFQYHATGVDFMKPRRRNPPIRRIGAKWKYGEYPNQQNGVQTGIQVGRDAANVDRGERVGFK